MALMRLNAMVLLLALCGCAVGPDTSAECIKRHPDDIAKRARCIDKVRDRITWKLDL